MSALWGKGGRTGLVALALAGIALTAPWAATAGPGGPDKGSGSANLYIPTALLTQAQGSPQDTFNVIVQGDGTADPSTVAQNVADAAAQGDKHLADATHKADDALAKAQKAAADAGAKAAGPNASPKDKQAAANAQADLGQAQAADAAANGAITQAANTIDQTQVSGQFSAINGVAATLTGDQLAALASRGASGVTSVVPDAPVQTSGPGAPSWSSRQLWPYVSGSSGNWKSRGGPGSKNGPAIAVVDSGIQQRSDFGGGPSGGGPDSRIIASVDLSSFDPMPGDGRGHGTFVAGIAGDQANGYAGADPAVNLVDVKVMGSNGMGLTSDVIKGCQWILANASKYNIEVANFSLHSDMTAPFYADPLDRAVEQLWFNGITVVAAAGNYGNPNGPSGVLYSPSDDPFVITVGAVDLNNSASVKNHTIAPWSAWGSTIDGFEKPEISAPGRYMIGPVPTDATLVADHPGSVVAPGYIELSGTSFAAPVVSAAAAMILAKHPSFTPDQVKGVLMLTAQPLSSSIGLAGGVGEVSASGAINRGSAPNPNAGLDQFVRASTGSGGTTYTFDSASWNSAAQSSASWNSASWNSASWNSASWNSASWNSASWNSASWNSASWNSASWNSASWNSASWNSASWNSVTQGSAAAEDGAEGDFVPGSQVTLAPAAVAALAAAAATR
jgi:serine protease AprX